MYALDSSVGGTVQVSPADVCCVLELSIEKSLASSSMASAPCSQCPVCCLAGRGSECLCADVTEVHIPEPPGSGCPCGAAEHFPDKPDAQ